MAHRRRGLRPRAVLLGIALAFLSAVPAVAGEAGPRREAAPEANQAAALARSIRIAEARNRPKAKRYFQSAYRQEKARRGRPGKRGGRPQEKTVSSPCLRVERSASDSSPGGR